MELLVLVKLSWHVIIMFVEWVSLMMPLWQVRGIILYPFICLLIITGLRLLGGATTDSIDASALGHSRNNIDIYSNSWGPPDDSVTVDGPKYLTSLALKEGAEMVYSVRNECCSELIMHYREGMGEETFLHLLLEMEEGFYLTLVQLMVIPRVYMLYQLVLMLRMVPLLLMMRNVQLNRL